MPQILLSFPHSVKTLIIVLSSGEEQEVGWVWATWASARAPPSDESLKARLVRLQDGNSNTCPVWPTALGRSSVGGTGSLHRRCGKNHVFMNTWSNFHVCTVILTTTTETFVDEDAGHKAICAGPLREAAGDRMGCGVGGSVRLEPPSCHASRGSRGLGGPPRARGHDDT